MVPSHCPPMQTKHREITSRDPSSGKGGGLGVGGARRFPLPFSASPASHHLSTPHKNVKWHPDSGTQGGPPTRFLADLREASAVPSPWEASGGCRGFPAPGGDAARQGAKGGPAPVRAGGWGPPRRPRSPRPQRLHPRDGPWSRSRTGAGGQPEHLSQPHVPQMQTGSWAAPEPSLGSRSGAAEGAGGGPQADPSGGHPDLGLQRSVRKINQ